MFGESCHAWSTKMIVRAGPGTTSQARFCIQEGEKQVCLQTYLCVCVCALSSPSLSSPFVCVCVCVCVLSVYTEAQFVRVISAFMSNQVCCACSTWVLGFFMCGKARSCIV